MVSALKCPGPAMTKIALKRTRPRSPRYFISASEAIRDAAAPRGVELGLVEAVAIPGVEPARSLDVEAHVRPRDAVAQPHADLARALGEARLVGGHVLLDGHRAAAHEHVGSGPALERVAELHVGVVEEAVELGPGDVVDGAGARVSGLGPGECEVAADGDVAVDLIGDTTPDVVAGPEVCASQVVEVGEGAETAPLGEHDDAPTLVFLGASRARREDGEQAGHGQCAMSRHETSRRIRCPRPRNLLIETYAGEKGVSLTECLFLMSVRPRIDAIRR